MSPNHKEYTRYWPNLRECLEPRGLLWAGHDFYLGKNSLKRTCKALQMKGVQQMLADGIRKMALN